MKKIIIWGTGVKAKRLYNYLNFDEVEILGFTDNSGDDDKKLWNGCKYLPRCEALKCDYDYIVIASAAYCEITAQLIVEGIDENKIIQADNVQFMIPDTLYFFDKVVTDQEKCKIFTDISLYSCVIV